MGIFEHPNVIGLKSVYKTSKNNLCIVLDHAELQCLDLSIRKLHSLVDEEYIISTFIQLVLAVKEIHDMNVIHRQIDPINILFTNKGFVRLGGFESAKCILSLDGRTGTECGADPHIAPEILRKRPYKISSDIWSLGITLYLLCCLDYPFPSWDSFALLYKITKGSYKPIPDTYSEPLQNLVSSLLTVDPEKRPTVDEILATDLLRDKVSEYVKGDLFKEEFLEIAKGSKRREEDLEEPEDLYERYVEKIEQVLGE